MTILRVWDRFWFTPDSTSTVGLLRVGCGVLVMLWALTLTPDVRSFYIVEGMAPPLDVVALPWRSLWSVGMPQHIAWTNWLLLVIAAACLTIGYLTRAANAVVVVTMLALHTRNPLIINSGDDLLRLICIYLLFAPAGAALSIDCRRHTGDPWATPVQAQWALRVVQLQLSVMYVSTVWAKVIGGGWLGGTAMWDVWNLDALHRFMLTAAIEAVPPMAAIISVGTVLIEFGLGTLVWSRRLRPWMLILGALLHLGIEATMAVGMFSWTVLVAYIAFVPPEAADRFIAQLRDALAHMGHVRSVRHRDPQAPSNAASSRRATTT